MQEQNQLLKSIIDNLLTFEEKIDALVTYVTHQENITSMLTQALNLVKQNQEAMTPSLAHTCPVCC